MVIVFTSENVSVVVLKSNPSPPKVSVRVSTSEYVMVSGAISGTVAVHSVVVVDAVDEGIQLQNTVMGSELMDQKVSH